MKEEKYIEKVPPFGYLINERNCLVVDKASSMIVRMIFELCESGMGNTLIARKLNQRNILTPSQYNYRVLRLISKNNKISKEWTPSQVGKILDNRVYCGDLIQDKNQNICYRFYKNIKGIDEKYIILENVHEPIIDKKRFYYIQELRESRKFNWNKRIEKIDIFDGVVICSNCKKPMKRIVTSEKEITGVLIKKYAYSCDICNNNFYIKEDTLRVCVLRSIKYHIDLLDNIEKAKDVTKSDTNYTKSLKRNVENMQNELKRIKKQKNDNYENWRNDEITELKYIDNMKKIINQKLLLEKCIKKEKDRLLVARMETRNIKNNLWLETLLKYQDQRKITKEIIKNLIEKIYIHKDGRKIRIKYKYEDDYRKVMNYLKNIQEGGNINA